MNNTNPQLPAEVVEEINKQAEAYADLQWGSKAKFISHPQSDNWDQAYEDYKAGATPYATKWFYSFEENGKLAATVADNLDTIKVLEYDNTRMKGALEGYREAVEEVVKDRYRLSQENDECMKNYNKLKEQATGWRPLLEEVLKLDDFEIAHISDELFEKIKRFLYGE